MVKVTVGTNTKRSNVTVNGDTKLKKVLQDEGIDYSKGTIHLDGATIKPGDLDKTFDELGITETAYLISVVKADSAQELLVTIR